MTRPASFRFISRPKWLFGHVLALAAVIGFVNFGFWQLRRHDERSAANATIESRMERGPVPWEEFLQSDASDSEYREFRLVSVSGTYDTSGEVLWQARTLNGRSGHDVLTPLSVDGRVVLINRGWVPIDVPGPPVAAAAPPEGPVTITGMVREDNASGRGPDNPSTGILDRIIRMDIRRLQEQFDAELYPFYLLLDEQSPEQINTLPTVRPPPDTDRGPHLGYAVQWFVFAAIAAIGYPILLARTSRDEAGSDHEAET